MNTALKTFNGLEKSMEIDDVTMDSLDDYLAEGSITPPHPGLLYNRLVIGRGNLKVTQVAAKAHISREMLHRILRGDAAITAKTAIGLADVAGNDPEFWLRAQQIYDLWKERERRRNSGPAQNF